MGKYKLLAWAPFCDSLVLDVEEEFDADISAVVLFSSLAMEIMDWPAFAVEKGTELETEFFWLA